MTIRYDGFGRLIERRRPSDGLTQHFSYNHQHQLIEARVDSHQHRSITRYQYDALGRRLNKTTEQYDKYSRQHTTTRTDFSWQGLRLSGERSSAQPHRQIRYIYNEQSYEPIAKLISDHQPQTDEIKQQIQYFHTLANSLPTELTNEQGQIIWQADYQLFGQIKRQHNRHDVYSTDKIEQNLRFAGQYYDNETGLHYNTFRYYDPNCGRFTQPDPIGLAGGINLYQYAPNTLTWVDPLGLCRRGNAETKKHMDKVRDQVMRDNPCIEHTDGERKATTGQELPETYLRPIGGGRRGGSYTDMTFNMDGKQTVYVQTVDRGKINGMSQREWNNAIRILKQDPNAILIAVPKGSIPSLGSLDISTMEIGKVNIR